MEAGGPGGRAGGRDCGRAVVGPMARRRLVRLTKAARFTSRLSQAPWCQNPHAGSAHRVRDVIPWQSSPRWPTARRAQVVAVPTTLPFAKRRRQRAPRLFATN